MSEVSEFETLADLQRLAMNAGRYGAVTISAHALLEVIGDSDLGMNELGDLIEEAESAAERAQGAADDAQSVADDLESVLAKIRRPRN